MKRWHTLSAGIILALLALGLFGWGLSRSAAAPPQATVSAGDTVVPMGPAQADVRAAYHDVLAHLYSGGRVHWAADAFGDGTLGLFIPEGLDTTRRSTATCWARRGVPRIVEIHDVALLDFAMTQGKRAIDSPKLQKL